MGEYFVKNTQENIFKLTIFFSAKNAYFFIHNLIYTPLLYSYAAGGSLVLRDSRGPRKLTNYPGWFGLQDPGHFERSAANVISCERVKAGTGVDFDCMVARLVLIFCSSLSLPLFRWCDTVFTRTSMSRPPAHHHHTTYRHSSHITDEEHKT